MTMIKNLFKYTIFGLFCLLMACNRSSNSPTESSSEEIGGIIIESTTNYEQQLGIGTICWVHITARNTSGERQGAHLEFEAFDTKGTVIATTWVSVNFPANTTLTFESPWYIPGYRSGNLNGCSNIDSVKLDRSHSWVS